MYESEMKESFIQDYIKSRVVAVTSLYGLFRKIEPFEERLQKDCCHFTLEEVLDMYEQFKAKSVHVVLNYNVILKAYCTWKKYYHKLDNPIAYEDVTVEMVKKIIPKVATKTISRDEITEIEEQLYNWTDKAIVECLWEGLSGNSMKDLTGITEDMIDHERMLLHLPDDRVFELTNRLYYLLIKAFDETEYITYGQTMKVKSLVGSGQIYKERDNAHAKSSDDKYFRWVYRKVQNYRKHVGIPSLTMKNISTSGMCYYLKKGMRETNLDLRTFLTTETGSNLMDKYGYNSAYRVDNVTLYYKDLV